MTSGRRDGGGREQTIDRELDATLRAQALLGGVDPTSHGCAMHAHEVQAQVGESHRDIAQSVGLAAQVRLFAGKYEEAVPFAKWAVELMEKAAGPDSTDTAVALQSLAATYSRAGKNSDALAIHRRVLDIQLRILGPEHLQTTKHKLKLD